MTNQYRRPALYPNGALTALAGGFDPENLRSASHDSAQALLARVRATPQPEIVTALVTYTDHHGIDAVAELWSHSGAETLPGALWRLYLLRVLIRQDPAGIAVLFQRGADELATIDSVVAGVPSSTGPDELKQLADTILRGAFEGDFAIALERASAFCRITASGCLSVTHDIENTNPDRARELTTRASRFITIANNLHACARLWRDGSLG